MNFVNLFESIFNFGRSVVDAVAARRKRRHEERLQRLAKKEKDEMDALIAGNNKSKKVEQSFDSQRELSHRP